MPVTPNFLERLVLLRLNKGPGPMLELLGGAGERAVAVALEMGVFEALRGGPRSPADLARELDADERGVSVLLQFLGRLGYVREADGRYENTRMTTKWLLSESANMADWLTFWDELVFPFWDEHLETAIRTGEPPLTMYEWFDEEPARWAVAQAGFRAAASLAVDETVEKVTVPPAADRLLDVGGGHGLYSVEFCRANPNLEATVFDVPEALDFARETIESEGMADRVTTEAGDYWTDDLGGGYDVSLLFNVVHANTPAENRRLFERVGDALAEGGQLVVMEQLDGSAPTPVGRTALDFIGLTYLVTLGGQIYPFEEVEEWLAETGFTDIRRTALRRTPGVSLVTATKSN